MIIRSIRAMVIFSLPPPHPPGSTCPNLPHHRRVNAQYRRRHHPLFDHPSLPQALIDYHRRTRAIIAAPETGGYIPARMWKLWCVYVFVLLLHDT